MIYKSLTFAILTLLKTVFFSTLHIYKMSEFMISKKIFSFSMAFVFFAATISTASENYERYIDGYYGAPQSPLPRRQICEGTGNQPKPLEGFEAATPSQRPYELGFLLVAFIVAFKSHRGHPVAPSTFAALSANP